MGPAQFGYLIGSFAIAILFAAVWLILCRFVPALRRRAGVSYGVAAGLACVPALLQPDFPNWLSLEGTAICLVLLSWGYTRALKSKTVAGTGSK
jgi:hypothetical protein